MSILSDPLGTLRTVRAIRVHCLCRKLTDQGLAELEGLCQENCTSDRELHVPESVAASLRLSEAEDLRRMLNDRADRQIILESAEMERHHRHNP